MLIDVAPVWVVFLATLVILFGSIELGFRAGHRTRGRWTGDKGKRTGLLASACLSMFAFMLAILFGIVESRHREQKHLVVEEATVIRAAFLQADLLHESDQAFVRGLLRDYANLRVEAAQPAGVQQIEQEIYESDKLLGELWSRAVKIERETPSRQASMFLQSSAKVIELHEKRVALAARYRLPSMVWWVLWILAILAMSIGGYEGGLSGTRRVVGLTLATSLAFTVVITLMVAMNQPQQLWSKQTLAPMVDLQEDIHSSMGSQP